jgi:ABC-type branched-subunit amino acid transport system ATPase component
VTAGLEVRSVTKAFGGRVVIDHLDLDVPPSVPRCLVGPNASGKSTLLNLIGGQLHTDGGAIAVDGVDVTGLATHRRRAAGISRTFQVPRVMPTLTVREHFRIASRHRGATLARLFRRKDDGVDDYSESWRALGLPALGSATAGALSHAHKKLLDVGIAMEGRPRVLLCDEPTAGLDNRSIRVLAEAIRDFSRARVCLIVEHNLSFIAALECQVSFLHHGGIVRTGSLDEVREDPLMKNVYLHAG